MSTIRDVARIAGVSISTVSLTLNEPSRVSPDTARKVADAARQVGYSANPIAQSLKSGRSKLIGMVVADITNPFFGNLLLEIERCAQENGYLVIVSDTKGKEANEVAILNHLSSLMVAGIIMSPCGLYEGAPSHIAELPMPKVLFDNRLPGIQSDFVGTDNQLASSMLTEHLIRLGHTRIAFVGGTTGMYTAELRKAGFLQTMLASGVTPDESLILDGQYSSPHSYEQTMRLMTRPDRPTAILAASNVMALGVLQACNDLSIACPEDVSLVGIDDVPWAAVIKPRITAAVQPVNEIARIASQTLISRIGGRGAADPAFSDLFLAPRLIMGDSTRPVV